jgi:phage-related protein
MTIRDIGILFGYRVDRNSENQVEDSVKSLKSMASKALGAIGLTLSVAGIAGAIKDCVSLASEVEEMENKFDVVFGEIRDDVDKWAQDYSDAIGRNKNDIKTYLADQQNLLVGFGMTRQAGAELSQQMTTLALDLASFGNIDETVAVDAMTKAIMGESEAAKTLGAVLNDSTREQAMLQMGLSGTYNSLDQLTKMQVNYQAILSQSPDAIGDCERSLGSYESTVRRFNSKLKEVKQLIGQFFMPTFQKVISYGTRGLTSLRNIIQKISDFAAKVGGAERILKVLAAALAATFIAMNVKKITGAVDGFQKLAKALGMGAGKALLFFAIFLLIALIIQDFIAFMRGDNSVIGALFDKAGIGADNARQTILNAWNTIKSFLLNVWEVIKGAAQAIFGALSAWWAENGEQVKESFSKIWEGIKTICEALWNALKSAAETIFSALKAFWDVWGETIITVFSNIWNMLISLIQSFLDAIAGIIDFLANVFTGNWEGAWNAIKDIASAIWEMITTILSTAWDNICAIWNKLAEIFGGFFQAAWDVIVEKVTGIKDAIVNGFQAAIDWILGLPAQAFQWGADIIKGIVDGIKSMIGAVGDAVSGIASKIKGFLGFSEPEDGPLSDFHTYMPDMIDLMAKGITAGKEKVKGALELVTGDMSVIAKSSVVSKGTAQTASGTGVSSRTVTQKVEINNTFNGDRAGQEKSAEAMDKASEDSTSAMARALATAR